jgi:hypothetical protein
MLIVRILLVFNLSFLVKYITRFTEDCFASLVAAIFIYDAIREPDLRGEQFRQTGGRLGTILGNAGEKLGGAAKATGRAVYDNLQPKSPDLQVPPEDYLSGKYNLDNLSNDDRLLLYEKMKAKGILKADRILTRSLNR